MDDPEAVPTPRGKTWTLRRIGPAAIVAAAISVACAFAVPGDASRSADGADGASDAKVEDFVHRFRKGQEKFGGGKDAEAEAIFRQLLVEEPDAAAVHHALAYIEWFRGHIAEAVEGFQKAAELAPEDGAIRRDCGLRLIEAGRPADALLHIEAARKLIEPDVETLCAHGRALLALRRPAEAEKAIRDAYKLDAGSVDARALLAQVIGVERPEEALKLLDGVPMNWPDVIEARAQALERLGRWDEAAAAHLRLAEIAPKGAAGLLGLRMSAEALVRCGDATRAVAVATKWAELDRAGDRPTLRASVCLAVAKAGAADAVGALAALDASPVPDALPAAVRAHLAMIRVHLLVESGQADKAREVLATVAASDAAFEKVLARTVLGTATAADLEAAAKADPGRANDLPWARWLAAKLAGDPAAAATARAASLDLTKPPGEHPGMLLRGAR